MAPSASPALVRAANAHLAVTQGLVLARYGTVFIRADRQRQRWDSRWESALESVWPKPEWPNDLDALIAAGEEEWRSVKKGPFWDAVRRAIRQIFGYRRDFGRRQMDVYLSLAADTAEDAGQHSLDAMGLNQTFRWTGARDMPRDMFRVRGSRIIQQAYGEHIDRLRQIILQATDPANPQTQADIRRQIQEEWSQLTASQVRRIARTESAAVWETTNYNTARANEITRFDWHVAHGPSIGPPTSLPVCTRCLERAINGPYDAPDVPMPPEHPNCRCTLIPALADDWLPPAETWSGGPNPPLPLVEAPAP